MKETHEQCKTKIDIDEFICTDLQSADTQKKLWGFKKRASPLSPGTRECVCLVPKKWDTDACNLKHRLVWFVLVPGHHPRFETYTNPFLCQITIPIDLAKNGRTANTICVNIGSLDIQADSGEIKYQMLTMMHMHLTLMMMMKRQRKHTSVTAKARRSMCLLATKCVLQSKHLLHAVRNFLTTKPILTPSKMILTISFGHPFQETITQGSSLWMDLKDLTWWEWLRQRRKLLFAIKQYRKARKSFTDKERLALMKSMSNKAVAILPQKSQLGIFNGHLNKMVWPME